VPHPSVCKGAVLDSPFSTVRFSSSRLRTPLLVPVSKLVPFQLFRPNGGATGDMRVALRLRSGQANGEQEARKKKWRVAGDGKGPLVASGEQEKELWAGTVLGWLHVGHECPTP
jgi:hypothetical protein